MAIEHEMTLLAAIMNGQHDWYTAAVEMGLSPEHFLLEEHGTLWGHITHLIASKGRWGLAPQVVTAVASDYKARQAAEALVARGPSFQVADHHVDQVLTDFWRNEYQRTLLDASEGAKADMKLPELQERLRRSAATLDSLAAGFNVARQDNGFHPVYRRTLEALERQLADGKMAWMTTGLPTLDGILGGGFQKPGAYTFCAMSGRGKTHMGIHFALEAGRNGASVLYLTVEMPQDQIMRRMISNVGRIGASRLMRLDLSEDELDRLQGVPDRVGDIKIAIEDRFRGELSNIRTLIRNYRRLGRLDFVILDYIQQVTDRTGRYSSKQQEMMHVAHELKQICIEEQIVMVQLAQANRDAEKAERAGDRLHAGHLEHSHAIYENSDAVVFLQGMPGDQVLWVAKNRHGRSDCIAIKLDYEHSRLTEE